MLNYYLNPITIINTEDYSLYMAKLNCRAIENNNSYPLVGSEVTGKNKKVSIRVELTNDEYELFSQYAKQEKISLRHLAKTRMLDSPVGLQEYKERQARRLPKLHALVDQIEDEELQSKIRQEVRDLYAFV